MLHIRDISSKPSYLTATCLFEACLKPMWPVLILLKSRILTIWKITRNQKAKSQLVWKYYHCLKVILLTLFIRYCFPTATPKSMAVSDGYIIFMWVDINNSLWRPILTPKTVLPFFFTVGIIFAPIGGVLLWASSQVCPDISRYVFMELMYWSFIRFKSSLSTIRIVILKHLLRLVQFPVTMSSPISRLPAKSRKLFGGAKIMSVGAFPTDQMSTQPDVHCNSVYQRTSHHPCFFIIGSLISIKITGDT